MLKTNRSLLYDLFRWIKKKWAPLLLLLGYLILVFFANPQPAAAADPPTTAVNPAAEQNKVVIVMFWGDGCPHCAAAKEMFSQLAEKDDRIELRFYEVWYDEGNQVLFKKMAKAYGFEPRGVPTIFIGNQYWEGFSDQIEKEILSAINSCLETGCPVAGAGILPGIEVLPTPSPIQPTETAKPEAVNNPEKKENYIDIPLLGTINLSEHSLFFSTLIISFIDGFNPCSIWVLTMLLAITLHTGSRKKVFLIGFIFLTVTAVIYALFIAGLFTVFTMVSFIEWIQVLVALVALFFALVNIKDYFFYKEGVSFTISDQQKPGIFQRIRRLMDASQSIWGLIGGTVVLAAGVSLVEFSCTAGFPVLWTNLLVSQKVTAITFILLLLVYLVIYQLDELGIFLVAVFSMRASKIEEKHGRILKLIGGVLMLSLAIVMIVKPSLMNTLSSSLVIFGIAFGVTLLILLVHRVILPKMGIHFGTEFKSRTSRKGIKKR